MVVWDIQKSLKFLKNTKKQAFTVLLFLKKFIFFFRSRSSPLTLVRFYKVNPGNFAVMKVPPVGIAPFFARRKLVRSVLLQKQ